jgi:penicillin-binding protein 1C
LGGVGISLEDLVALYAAIPNGGKAAHLRFETAETLRPTAALFGEEAASQVSAILAGTPRPDGVSPARDRRIAYKTGTSYGFRDAWSFGYSEAYTVGVWVGRVDGTPRPGETGREAAAPILFQIFDMLPDEPSESKQAPLRSVTDTPGGLREFVPASATNRISGSSPEILFPPSGAVLEISSGASELAPIDLEAAGGEPPYLWVVDGNPLPPSPTGTHIAWTPKGIGFVQISVIDRNHESATVEFRVE